MLISETKYSCNNCGNKKVCKFTEEYLKTLEKLKNVDINKEVPIKISVACYEWRTNVALREYPEHDGRGPG